MVISDMAKKQIRPNDAVRHLFAVAGIHVIPSRNRTLVI